MAAIETSLANAFETSLTANVTGSDLTFPVGSVGSLTSPTYLVIDPDNPTKREYVFFDGTFTSTDLVTTVLANRGLAGSASGAQGHTKGAKVRAVPMQQHFEDLHDRMDTAYTVGGADVAVADGGTGASTAPVARTNLGAAADAEVVHLAGAETISGAKTFSVDPTLADGSSALSLTEGNAAYFQVREADEVVTVGAAGTYTTINAALEAVSRKRPLYGASLHTVEISLLTGFTMAEQVLVNGIDLGWVRITSVDAVVPVTRSALTTAYGPDGSIPLFGVGNGGVLPEISALFSMDVSGVATNRHGIVAFLGGFAATDSAGGSGVRNAGGRGLYAAYGGKIVVWGDDFSGAGEYGMAARHSGVIQARDTTNVSNAGSTAVFADWMGLIHCRDVNAINAGANGIKAENGGRVYASGAKVNGAVANGFFADTGGYIGVKSMSLYGASANGVTGSAVYALRGGTVEIAADVGNSPDLRNAGGDAVRVWEGRVLVERAVGTGAAGLGVSARAGIAQLIECDFTGSTGGTSNIVLSDGAVVTMPDTLGTVSQDVNAVLGTGVALNPAAADYATLDATGARWGTGYYYLPQGSGRSASAGGVGLATYVPIWVPPGRSVTRIGCEVTTAAAGAVIRFGIYADNGDGRPGALVAEGSTTADASTTGAKDVTITASLDGGVYWLCAVSQTASAALKTLISNNQLPVAATSLATAVSSNIPTGYYQSGITAALPATATIGGATHLPYLVVVQAGA